MTLKMTKHYNINIALKKYKIQFNYNHFYDGEVQQTSKENLRV